MTLLISAVPHGLPHWWPFAILAGALVGFIAGCYVTALFALWLARRQPDPAIDPLAQDTIDQALEFAAVGHD